MLKLLLILFVIAAPVAGWFYYQNDDQTGQQNFVFDVAAIGNIENSIVATGQLEPKKYVEVGAQVSGQVEKIYVEEGQEVKQGQLLAEIDATVFETKVQNAAAALENKRAQLAQLEAELELAELRAKRNQSLFAQNAVSEDTLMSSQTNVKVLKARIRASQATIKADEASLAGDQATLDFAKIYAPISGTVASIKVREGQTLNASQNAPTILQISDLSLMTLRAEVSEADVNKITRGMPVYFSTLGNLKRRWNSQVRQILPTPNVINDVVLYQVLVDVKNDDRALMDSMTTQVMFVVDKAENTLLVPLSAVRKTLRGAMVRVKRGDTVERQPVKIGVENRTQIQILSGLNEGDQVVIGQQGASGPRRADNERFGQRMGGRRGF
ncbi:efflux RND transporter periplasmic adaptor subunit [Gayadomonas joobiniege]|uniref:efflux RND transporter periplasmic adaptor subunit n=1 Tax=Gayadomonas joobiniege TaxID=1234606 RepID=UPI001ED9C1FC|nr:efflux RND transporter periplasmic adaptor subunit [Gayadomonas joobiniege]